VVSKIAALFMGIFSGAPPCDDGALS